MTRSTTTTERLQSVDGCQFAVLATFRCLVSRCCARHIAVLAPRRLLTLRRRKTQNSFVREREPSHVANKTCAFVWFDSCTSSTYSLISRWQCSSCPRDLLVVACGAPTKHTTRRQQVPYHAIQVLVHPKNQSLEPHPFSLNAYHIEKAIEYRFCPTRSSDRYLLSPRSFDVFRSRFSLSIIRSIAHNNSTQWKRGQKHSAGFVPTLSNSFFSLSLHTQYLKKTRTVRNTNLAIDTNKQTNKPQAKQSKATMKRPIGATFSSFDDEDEDATTTTTTSLSASLYPLQRALSESIRRTQLYQQEQPQEPQDEQLRDPDHLYVSSQFEEAHEHDPHGWKARSITSPTQANSGTHTPSLASPITTTTTSTSTPALSPPSNQILTQEMILQRPPAAPKKRFTSLGRTASTTSPSPDQNDDDDDEDEPAASSYYYYIDGRGKSPDSVFRPLRMELDDTEDNYTNNNGILRKLHPLLSMPSNLGMDEEEEQQQQELLKTPRHHQYPAHRRYHSVDVLSSSSIEFPDLDRLVSSPLSSHCRVLDPEQLLAPRPRPKRLFLQHDDDHDWQESNSSLSTVASTNSPTSPTTQPVLFRCGSMDSGAGTARLAPRLTRRGGYHKRHGSTNTLPTLISRSSSMTSTLARGYHAGYHPSLASSTSSSSLDPAAVFSSSSTSPLFLPILNHDEQETNKEGQPPQVQWNPATPTTRTTSSLC